MKFFCAKYSYCVWFTTNQMGCLNRLFPKFRGTYSFQELRWRTLSYSGRSCLIYHKVFPNSEVAIVREEIMSSSLHFICAVVFRFWDFILTILAVIEAQWWFAPISLSRNCSVVVPDFEVSLPLLATFVILHHSFVLFRAYACFL